MRAKTLPRFTSLSQASVYPAMLKLLSAYVHAVIPGRPEASAGAQWVITSLPSTSSYPGTKSLTRMSVNIVETLFLASANEDPSVVLGYLNVAADTKIPDRFLETSGRVNYQATGQVTMIEFEGLEELARLLQDADVVKGAARLVRGLFDRGRSLHARNHDFNLSDAIVHEIS